MKAIAYLVALVAIVPLVLGFVVVSPPARQRQQRRTCTRLFAKVQKQKANHEKTWQSNFDKLQGIINVDGPGSSAINGDEDLYQWLQEQRRQHQLLAEGKKCRLTKTRATALERMGVIGDSDSNSSKHSSS